MPTSPRTWCMVINNFILNFWDSVSQWQSKNNNLYSSVNITELLLGVRHKDKQGPSLTSRSFWSSQGSNRKWVITKEPVLELTSLGKYWGTASLVLRHQTSSLIIHIQTLYSALLSLFCKTFTITSQTQHLWFVEPLSFSLYIRLWNPWRNDLWFISLNP